MKKQFLIIIILVFGISLFTTSCKKKGCTNETALNYDADAKKDDDSCEFGDTTKPVITIMEPTESMYHLMNGSATIPIKVEASDDDELHSLIVSLKNTGSGDEEIHLHLHPDAATASIDTSFTGTVAHQDYELTVTAEDHSGNKSEAMKHTHIHMM